MKGSVKLFNIFGISINIHLTFFLLLLLFISGGPRWLTIIGAVFFFVTVHELCHSLVAKHFGVTVREITLLPMGGVASMSTMPEKPLHEFLISIAGPLFNLSVIAMFYFPMKYILGESVFFHELSARTWPLTFAYIYWINLILAAFNMIPAFPMDGGRILRAVLTRWMTYQKATKLAVTIGQVFALIFAYFGIMRFNIVLVIIAVFIYTAASGEETQVDIRETLKKFRVRDILSSNFFTVTSDTTLAKVLEIITHSRQEDFPVVDDGVYAGFITRQDIISNIHRFGMERLVRDMTRKDIVKVKDTDYLLAVHNTMQTKGLKALPVMRNDHIAGVITLEDISRVYAIASERV